MHITIPNIVSCIRIALAPLVYALIVADRAGAWQLAAAVFFLGALTDYIDGWLARKRGEVTSFGVFFDPLADKILVSAAFLGFAEAGMLPLWPVLVVIARDVITTLLRSYADSIGQPVVTSRTAKAKTFLQMSFIVWLLASAWLRTEKLIYSQTIARILESDFTYFAMLALTGYTIWTGVEYLWENRLVVKRFFRFDVAEYMSEWLATGFGVGYAPFMPGTFGALAALGLLLLTDNHYIFLGFACIAFILGYWAIPIAEKKLGDDSSNIVLDECIGMWLVLAWPYTPLDPAWSLAGFGLFRLFDITKPFPINLANRRRGAFWVLFDDILAAFVTVMARHVFFIGSMYFPLVLAYLKK